jgi:TRAP transporter 4TM/12TM fusion protein
VAESASTAASAPAPAINEQEFGSSWRALSGPLTGLLFILSVAFAAFHLLNLNYLALDSILFRIVHLCGGAALAFALVRSNARDNGGRIPWYDWFLIAACLAVALHFIADFAAWQMRAGATYTTRDLVASVAGTFIVLEFVRRTAGWALTIIALVFIVYGFVGPWMPGSLYHKGFDLGFWFTSIFSENGVFGQTLEVSSTFIIMFVVFAAFLSRSGAGDYFNDLSVALVGWARGGPAKVAVVSGVMFGSISGSSVANVVASGTITIPMMRRVGYDRATAGAIEATSSTGGQITPPVLGAGAFIMAEITATPYAQIAYMAIIPCLLFYVANYAHCHLHALRHGLRGIPRAELPSIGPMLLKIYFIAPIFFLIYAFITGFSAFRAAALGMIAAILVTVFEIARDSRARPALRAVVVALAAALLVALLEDDLPAIARLLGLGAAAPDIAAALKVHGGKRLFFALAISSIALAIFVGWLVKRETSPFALAPAATPFGMPGLAKALDTGTRDSLQLIACCAAAGIVAGAIATTGIGQRLAYVMLAIAGQSKLLAMLFTAIIVTILGMGMPTTAAYAIAASVVAPGLIQIGIDKLVAHMFIFYFAVMSAITPPVAVASFAAAAMAKADPWRTSWIACRNGLAAFLVPFLFFYSPVLLGRGDWQSVAAALASAIVGVYFLACATEGWLNGPLTVVLRVLLGAAALGLMLPELYSTIAGLAIGLAIFAYQRTRHGADPADKVPTAAVAARAPG